MPSKWLLPLLSIPLAAQPPVDPAKALSDFLDLARQQPVEYFADSVFRLQNSARIRDRAQVLKLMEAIFERAPEAKQWMPVQPAQPVLATERARVMVLSQRFQVERITIQARVIDTTLTSNPKRAREMIHEIVAPPQQERSCDDALVPSPATFYETMQRVMLNAANGPDAVRSEGLRIILDHLVTINSALQVGPVAEVIRIFLPGDPDGQLLSAYGTMLSSVQDSDRPFSFAINRLDAVASVLDLADAARAKQQPIGGLVASLRVFLVRHLKGARCADNVQFENATAYASAQNLLQPIQLFNSRAPRMTTGVDPIGPDDRKPSRTIGSFVQPDPNSRVRYVLLLDQIRQLRQYRGTQDFRYKASDVMSAVDQFPQVDGQAALDYFHQKSMLNRLLLQSLPSGDQFTQVLTAQVSLLATTTARREAPSEWMYHVDALLQLARPAERQPPSREMVMQSELYGVPLLTSGHPAGPQVIDALVNSYEPSLSLYGRLERLAPPPPR
jgi:hypothetical protein